MTFPLYLCQQTPLHYAVMGLQREPDVISALLGLSSGNRSEVRTD
jgi:hypothetical protein